MRNKSYSIIYNMPAGETVRIDFRWALDKNEIRDFSINLSLLEGEKSIDVYRLDTSHGYIHEHRLWKSLKPERIEENYNRAFAEKKEEILNNFARWIALFKKSRGGEYG